MSKPKPVEMIGRTFSHYRIVAPLGQGGMGIIYRAEDLRLGREVALKFLPPSLAKNPDALERFQREARAASALNHPNICTLFDIGGDEHEPFLVMELLEGETLAQHMAGKPLPAAKLMELATQIADALEAAHAKGIVHRDIKPGNLFLTTRGQVKIMDFGVAKLTAEGKRNISSPAPGEDSPTTPLENPMHTTPGFTVGTVAYMSPEQALGHDIDGRSDLFSLGVVLYEMATGTLPFNGKTTAGVFDAILHHVPPPASSLNPHLPAGLDVIIAKALEKDPEVRCQTASELRADLKRLARDSGSAVVAAAARPLSTPRSIAVRKTIGLGSAVAVLAAVVALAAAGWWATHRSKPMSERDTIVLADFANATGEPVFDVTLKRALAVQLEQSPYLNILSEQRVRDALKLAGRSPDDRVTNAIARDICQRYAFKAMLTGSVVSLGKGYVVQLEAVNCATGDSIAREQMEAPDKEHVLKALGQSSSAMRRRLGESLSSIRKMDMPIDQATTPSLEAFQAFALGEAQRTKGAEMESVPFYERAIQLDPNFARAYGALGVVYSNQGETQRAREYLKKAFALIDRVSEREKLYLQGHYYGFVTREIDKNIQTLQLAVQSYPRDPTPHINLSAAYSAIGQNDKGTAESREALRLDPSISNAYSNLAFGLLDAGRLDESKAVIAEARSRGMQGSPLHDASLFIALLENDKAEVEKQTEWASQNDHFFIFSVKGMAELAHGRLGQADQYRQTAEDMATRHALLGSLSRQAGFRAIGLAEFGVCEPVRKLAIPSQIDDAMPVFARAFARCGETTKAQKIVDILDADCPTDTLQSAVHIPLVRAAIALEQKQAPRAVELLKTAVPYENRFVSVPYLRGLAYLQSGSAADAMKEFQKVLDEPGIPRLTPDHALAYVGLARAATLAGDPLKARKAYQDFFAVWKDADPDIPILIQAKEEYARL